MNILFLVRLWPEFGGGETVTRTLANKFVSLGHNVSVAYFVDSQISDFAFVDDRITSFKIEDVECNQYYYDVSKSEIVEKQICDFILSNEIEIVINQWFPLEYTKSIITKTKAKVIKCYHTAFRNEVSTKERFYSLFHKINENANLCKELVKVLISPLYERYLQRESISETEQYFPYVDKYVFLSSRFLEQYIHVSKHYQYREKLYAIPNPLSINNLNSADNFQRSNFAAI